MWIPETGLAFAGLGICGWCSRIFLTIARSVLCWGSWLSPARFFKHIRLEVFFLDLSLAQVLVALIMAATLGSTGSGPSVFIELANAQSSDILHALLAGAILNVGNLMINFACVLVGLAIGIPTVVGISVAIGVTLSYLISPDKNDPALLFAGVILVLIAVVLNGASSYFLATEKISTKRTLAEVRSLSQASFLSGQSYSSLPDLDAEYITAVGTHQEPLLGAEDDGDDIVRDGKIIGRAVDVSTSSENSSTISAARATSLMVVLAAAIGSGAWTPLMEMSMKDADDDAPDASGLSCYSCFLLLTLGMLVTSWIYCLLLMRWPIVGPPIPFSTYFQDGLKWHFVSLFSGTIWALGMGLNLSSSQRLGMATSFAIGQTNPIIGGLWGLLVFREFEGSKWRSRTCFAVSVAFYLGAVALVSFSTK